MTQTRLYKVLSTRASSQLAPTPSPSPLNGISAAKNVHTGVDRYDQDSDMEQGSDDGYEAEDLGTRTLIEHWDLVNPECEWIIGEIENYRYPPRDTKYTVHQLFEAMQIFETNIRQIEQELGQTVGASAGMEATPQDVSMKRKSDDSDGDSDGGFVVDQEEAAKQAHLELVNVDCDDVIAEILEYRDMKITVDQLFEEMNNFETVIREKEQMGPML